ncbi:MAG: hypothetical protein CMF41_01070 [Legionellales bacterium]|nr:hypothetical protein [Legionellales bacterium]|tara:strand:+ start:467 stop:895 length:429 start_codon:yes stop_codon:yes gene_type:complete
MKILFKLLGVCLLIQSAFGVVKQFNQADFENALKENKRIVISVKAIWCGHCIAQQSVFKEISGYPPYSDMLFMNVVYSGDQAVKNQLNKDFIDEYNEKNPKKLCTLSSRSTIVVIDEGKVVACKAFITSEESITRLIQTPIQ